MSTFSPSPLPQPIHNPELHIINSINYGKTTSPPLVRTAWLGLGCCCCKGYLHLNDCWWDGDGMILPHFLMRTEHMNWDSWGDWWSRFIGERNKLLFVCGCDYWHAAVVAVTILSSIFLLLSCCCWYCLHYVYVCHHCVHRIDNL